MGGQAEDFLNVPSHVQGFKHAIALVQDKMLYAVELEILIPSQSQNATGGSHHNVRAVVLENFLVLLDRDSSVKDSGLYLRQVLAESLVLVGNLESEFTGVANNQNRDLGLFHIGLLEGREGKDGGFTHSRLGLANDIASKNGLGDGLVLNFRGMLESRIDNGSQKLRLEHKVLEPRRVDTNVMAFFGFLCFLSGSGLVANGNFLFFVVVDEFVFVVIGHGDDYNY
mmetsp:Transcript_13229/g.30885  ORF Transcript_13229/g.30885 Transcript_13229/m.30885 type:complete len:226 (-) Transcript_13229:39-716(-)